MRTSVMRAGVMWNTLLIRPVVLLITVLIATVSTYTQAQVDVSASPSDIFTVEAAVNAALADNPGLAAMKARVEALASVPAQQGALPDPRLSLNLLNIPLDSFDLQQEAMTQVQIGFSQMLPYPGKLALRTAVAEHETTAARWQVDEMRLKLERDVRIVWWNLFFTDRGLEIIERNKQLLRQFVDVAQTKYKVGKGLQQDVLLAQLELSKLYDRVINLTSMRRNQAVQLNALLNRPTTYAVQLSDRSTETLSEINDEQGLLARATKNRPLLAVGQSNINAARARLGLAKKDYSPNFNVGVTYGYRGGDNVNGSTRADLFSVKLSVNLPLYTKNRQDKAVDQRTRQLLQQQYLLDDERGRVAAEVSQALADYQRSREQTRLFKQGIIPQASQTVAAMLAAYQVNKVDFLNLVRAQVTLFNYETRYWKALSQGKQAQARLRAAVGQQKQDVSNNKNNKNNVEVSP